MSDADTIAALRAEITGLQARTADLQRELTSATAPSLQLQLDALKQARRSGTRTLTFGERSHTLRTDAELVAAIASLEGEIAAAEGSTRPRSVVVRSGKCW